MSNNTGFVSYLDLEEYFLDNGNATGGIKPNSPSDPNYYPEVYDPVVCPPMSLSPTPSLTPTPTVTPSPSTPSATYKVYVNATILNISLNQVSNIYYKINAGSWNLLGVIENGNCYNLGSITLTANTDTLYLGMTTPADVNDPTSNPSDPSINDYDIIFNAVKATNCNKIDSDPYCGLSNPYSVQVTNSDVFVALGAITDPQNGLFLRCAVSTARIAATPSTSPQPYFNGTARISSNYFNLALSNTSETIDIISNATVFANSTYLFSRYFETISSDNYFISDTNSVLYVNTDETAYAKVIESGINIPPAPSITPTATPSVSVGAIPTIVAFGANLTSCYLSNDYIAPYVILDIPSLYDITYNLNIELTDGTIITFPYTIVAGNVTNSSLSNPCIGEVGILNNPGTDIYSVCISNINAGLGIINNPFGYCIPPSVTPSISITSTPSITPSVTPSVTPSITSTPSVTSTTTPSVTPSISPDTSVTPSVTPTITPSVTRTPSITPTRTPSVTRTPSLTPTRTPSITPSSTPPLNFFVNNIYGFADISNVTSGGSAFYTITGGSFPLQWNDSIVGTGTTSNAVTVTISNFSAEVSLLLYKNETLQECLTVTGNGNYTFAPVAFSGSDVMYINLTNSC
jgi:hypothetical protein